MEHQIADISNYNDSMRKSLIDKMFFMDKVVDATTFIDFGCADGKLLKWLQAMFPDNNYIGYDYDPKMIELASQDSNIFFTDSFQKAQEAISGCLKTCLILNSVIHEVYTYGPENIKQFWENVFNMNTDYIVMRDMSVSRTASRPSDAITVARIRQVFDSAILGQWESVWGSLEDNWSLTHFLLKYKYQENWARELRENYLPINKEDILAQFPNHFIPEFIEHYTLPFTRNQVMKDFNVQLQERTHLKLIFKNTSKVN